MNEVVHRTEMLFENIVEGLVDQDFAIADHFLDAAEIQLLTQELERQQTSGHFKAAGIGQKQDYQQDKSIRGDQIRWIERENLAPSCHFFLDRVEDLINFLNRTCYLGIRASELHFAVYPVGSFYKRHLDVFQKTRMRKISVVCYLNHNWQVEYGGQLRLYLANQNGVETTKDILPQAGRLVCFKSEVLEHEVLPANRERLSITGWLKSDGETQ